MTKPSTEDLLIGAARGEPMGVEEREQLDAALSRSKHLQVMERAQQMLSRDLTDLRATLAGRDSPSWSEDALRAAFRAHRVARAQPASGGRLWGLVTASAVAASLAAVVVSLGMVIFLSPEPRVSVGANTDATGQPVAESEPTIRAAGSASSPAIAERLPADMATAPYVFQHVFQPLIPGPPPSPSAAYSIVRVRIPVTALALHLGTELQGTIEADILLGEDGLASGIRFVEDEALLAAANAEPMRGSR